MAQRVYIETTIASYLTARPSRDVVIAGHQATTTQWWNTQRQRFDLYVSELVLLEASKGDPAAAALRLSALNGIDVLDLDETARELARRFVDQKLIPQNAIEDALHVAVATAQGMHFLLTWNCRHIANAEVIERLESVCLQFGYRIPLLCTPEQLMGD